MQSGRLNVLLALGAFGMAAMPLAARAQGHRPARVELITGVRHGVSPPMRDVVPTPPSPSSGVIPLRRPVPARPGMFGTDPALQTTTATATSPNTTSGLNFDGIASDGYIPPDTNLAVGATQVVQVVNVEYAVYDKTTGAQIQAPRAIHNVFSKLGAPCGTADGGDPVVLYDKAAGRWLISQLEYNSSFTSNYECVAISQTSDVTGSFNLYSFSFGSNLPDYPKWGSWPDAYYLSANLFANGSSFVGAAACAYPRSLMLAGSAVSASQTVCFQTSTSEASLLPADLDGSTSPAAGETEFYTNFDSGLELYRFHVDFTTPSNSTFTGPIAVSGAASFNEACSGGTCVPQPGTRQKLDSLGDRLMFRLAYRNFGSYESLVVTHSVQVSSSSNQTGIRWYEIRNPTGTPTAYQQGTYSPDTTTYRWMGSIAQDQNADIAVGYSVSASSSVYPGIRYAGRVPGDSLGMLEAEATIVNGSASQSGTYGYRWGDYSAMSIDPSDDCTFWYTTEYIVTGGSFNWNTRIASFKFTGCGATTIPAAPTGLTATAGNAQVSLTWNASSGAASYTLLRSVSGGSYSELVAGLTSTGYTDSGLTNGAQYCYEVEAVNSFGPSSPSSASCATPVAPPATPANLTATAGNAQVALSWSSSTGATSYTLLRSIGGGSYSTLASGLTSTSYTDTGLTNGTQYCYEVEAVNAGGASSPSGPQCATPTGPPPAPTNLTATAGNAQVSLAWNTSSGASSYNVYRSTTSGGPYTKIGSSATTNYTDSTVSNGTTYYYVVTAVNSSNQESGNSNQASATPQAATLPNPPTGLVASGAKRKINLTWTQSTSPGITGNNVYQATGTGGTFSLRATLSATTSYSDTSVTRGTTYCYEVTAVNSGGESAPSNSSCAAAR